MLNGGQWLLFYPKYQIYVFLLATGQTHKACKFPSGLKEFYKRPIESVHFLMNVSPVAAGAYQDICLICEKYSHMFKP